MEMEPVEPELDVPELKTRAPLTPASPAFAERIEMAPLDVANPSPLIKPIAPPVCAVLRPAATVS
jgi:hypothetical protein